MKERITLTIDKKILAEIDKKRGYIPRATYVNEELRKIFTPGAAAHLH